MTQVGRFYTVSFKQFSEAMKSEFPGLTEDFIQTCYDELKLPTRATKGSAGNDFKSPFSFTLKPGETIKIPTGIRCEVADGWFLSCFPRSGLGFKYRLQLDNTVGIIDADYAFSDNEGHIFAKITNDSKDGKVLEVNMGDGFMQGIFQPFGIAYDDDTNVVRNGGMGSTGA